MLGMPDSRAGDMKIPTFYAIETDYEIAGIICLPIVGVVFGGIHCAASGK